MTIKLPIFMDNHSTTPVDPRVVEAMLPYFNATFGNAASRQYRLGWDAQEAVEHARAQVATLIGAAAKDIVWTSGATEIEIKADGYRIHQGLASLPETPIVTCVVSSK